MGRRGRRDAPGGPNGLLLVDKPQGPTSFDVVARVRRALREAPLELRMVYLFSTLGGQNAAAMATYSGFSEGDIRAARAQMAWAVVRAVWEAS